MACKGIIGDGDTYWNIKGCGHAARVFTGKCLFFRRKQCGHFYPQCATNVPLHFVQLFSADRQSKLEEIHGKTQN